MVIICSKRFVLRPFKKGDEKSMIKNINDRTIAKNTLRIPYPYKLKDARWWINHNFKLDKNKKKHEINFAVEINGEVAGGIGLDKIYSHSAEIGYWLGKDYRRKRIMTEVVKLVTEYAFQKLKLRRVYAFVFLWNKASSSVLKKNGYKFEGKLRKHVKKGGKLLDNLLFAKVK
jgi:RimJ/RimL family protein N-acetyltransferase